MGICDWGDVPPVNPDDLLNYRKLQHRIMAAVGNQQVVVDSNIHNAVVNPNADKEALRFRETILTIMERGQVLNEHFHDGDFDEMVIRATAIVPMTLTWLKKEDGTRDRQVFKLKDIVDEIKKALEGTSTT
jgi:hypothetical protein